MSDNGMPNPQGLLMAAVGPAFLVVAPLTSYLTPENGVVQKLMETLLVMIPGGASIAKDRTIPALSAWYIFVTFAASAAGSAAGVNASSKQGIDNNHPRANINSLRGLPLRLRSAHYNLMEMFPAFALVAAMSQTLAPANQQIINLLGLHVILKTLVFYPAYIANIAPVRSFSHLFAIASVINVVYKLAMGAA